MSSNEIAAPQQEHRAAISRLFGDPRWTDLEVHCGRQIWKVHRIVVCSQSTFFERAVEGGFAEATTGVVNLVEDDAFAVQALLQYFYSGDYLWQPTFSSPDGVENNPGPLAFAVAVHTIAEKYEVRPLMSLAMAKSKALIGTNWQRADFVDAVEAIYEIPPEKTKEMRERLVEIVSKNYRAFKDGKAFANCQAVFEFAPFVAEVLDSRMGMRTMPAGFTLYVCPSVNCRKWTIMQTMRDETVRKHCPHCGGLWFNTPLSGWLRG
ncbi:hypothetical protein CB0940_08116 [Cercospora beticola]|uniref:BTB domain-containing protein n=1 Tax=Cercospora beticola TaxID=122368 RepID=A0A2G5HR31_CERBT|nr:hypothetical protein CB0940_08116 [Cercospora beticola]PIA94978.1 hypothetical protein CB0940_08116 [Cercospora beticola]WPB04683.1 hypothetical protein RHO25_009330 [Cercospora beticola]CAK1364431.1 unnamed protein product [Cercospora beticola]